MYVMRRVTVAAMAIFCAMVGVNSAFAQGVPAEIPPASFRGEQYVDSRGCAFVRVGMGGNTQWVPRVSGNRRQICNLSPSLSAAPQTATARTAPAAGQSGVTIIGGVAPAQAQQQPQPARSGPAPQPRLAAPVQPAVRGLSSTSRPAAAQSRSVATTPRVLEPRSTAPAATGATGACPNLPADLRPFFTGANPRCGPQRVHPGDALRGRDQSSALGQGSTAQPRQLVRYQVNPPPGYRAAWDDGRLNPNRGLGTALGQRQMEAVWTNTTPRRLVGTQPRGLQAVFTRASRPAQLAPAQLVIVRP